MRKIVKEGCQLTVKDWMARKIKEEKKLSGSFHYTEVYAILKETEKAYQVMMTWGTFPVTTWVPKSATERSSTANNKNSVNPSKFQSTSSKWVETDREDFITSTFDSYEEAKAAFDLDWGFYK